MQNGCGTSQKSLRKLTARATRWWRFSLPRGTPPTTSLKRPRRLTPRPPGGRWICSCPPGSRSLVPCVPWPWRPWVCRWFPSQVGRLGCRPTAATAAHGSKRSTWSASSLKLTGTTPSSLSPASRGSTSMVTSPPWDGEGLTPPPWPWPRP